MDLDHYTLCFLVANPEASLLPGAEEDALQDRHMTHLAELHDEGVLLAAGPCRDGRIRGACIFSTDVAETLALMQDDPAVRAGWFTLEVLSWMVPEGTHVHSRAPLPRAMDELG